jgi:aldehyde:ferredoxin oxidoreductase
MESRFGWTGKILKINLTEKKISELSTHDYSELFIGGLGIGEKIYWDETVPETKALDPDNPLIMMTGPLCGTTAPSASRMVVCGKSPMTFPERFVNASIAGFFPAELKKAGFDGIVLTGKADTPVCISIEEGAVKLCDAGHLWGLKNSEAREKIAEVFSAEHKVMSIGPGCENNARMGTLLIDLAGSAGMGFGSVMGSKNVKAIVVKGTQKIPAADPDAVKQVRNKLKKMTGPGYHSLYDQSMPIPGNEVVKKVYCHGCFQGCWRSVHRRPSGLEGIRKCQTVGFYMLWDMKKNGSITDTTFQAMELANEYSLCIHELLFLLLWVERAAEQGILNNENTGLALSEMGSLEFIETFMQIISKREGFGKILAEGALRAAETFGEESKNIVLGFLTRTGRPSRTYGPKSFILSAPIHAVEQRPAITSLHEICHPLTKWAMWYMSKGEKSYVSTEVLRNIAEKFWGGKEAVDFSTYEGKAKAAVIIQNREYAKECLVLCDLVWPVHDDASADGHVGDPSLESKLLSAVTGREISEEDLCFIGARVFELNRAIMIRDGRKGREEDVLSDSCFISMEEPPADIFDMYNPERFLPGKDDELISHKAAAVDREKFEKLMDEYYELRGWDIETGLLKKENLKKLGIPEIAEALGDKVI